MLARLLRRRRSAPPPGRTIIVDGQNVRRSTWPNVEAQRLVDAVERWGRSEHPDAAVVVYFDGRAPVAEPAGQVEVRTVPYVDDELVTLARARVEQGGLVLVATSDRELRARLEQVGAEVAWGGGRFLDELGLARRRRR